MIKMEKTETETYELKDWSLREVKEHKRYLLQEITQCESELSEMVEELEKREKYETYHVGQRFVISNHRYILAQTGFSKINFVSLEDGNRYSTAVHVEDNENITKEELGELCDNWELIE